MSSDNDALAEAGMALINEIDAKLQEPGNEEALEFWKDGEYDACHDRLSELFPDVSSEQWDWIEEFVSEI
jgi:hypothetical protein